MKSSRIVLFAFLALGLLLAACEKPRSNRTPQPKPVNFEVKAGNEPGVDCECPTARQYYLHNLTDDLRNVSFTEYQNDLFNPVVDVVDRQAEIPGKGRFFLSCSPQTVNKSCDTVYSWKIDDQLFHTDQLYKFSAGSGNKNFIAGDMILRQLKEATKVEHVGLSCRQECLIDDGARCMTLNVSGAGDADAGRKLLSAIGALGDDGRLTRKRVLDFYDQQDEPCNRSDIVVADGVLSNTGVACEIQSSWGGPNSSVTIGIPSALVGELSHSKDGFELKFQNALASPSLMLEDRFLNPVFGGMIRSIEKIDSHLLVQTGNACIGLKVQ